MRRWSLLVGFLSMSGCTNSESRVQATPVSAISTIVEVEIGVDSTDRMYQVRGAFFLFDTVFVAVNGQTQVRVYGADGMLLRTIGRLGDGPGEFRSVTWMQRADSSFHVYDQASRRVSEFGFDGSLIHSTLIQSRDGKTNVEAVGVFGDHTVLARSADSPPPTVARTWRSKSALMKFAANGETMSTIDSIEESESYEEPRPRGGGLWTALPFGVQSSVVVGRNRYALVSSDSTVVWRSSNGAVEETVQLPFHSRVELKDVDRRTARERFIGENPPRLRLGEVFDRMVLPRTAARYGWHGSRTLRLASLTSENRLWVVRAGTDDERFPVWEVLSPFGRMPVRVSAATEMDILDEREGRVLVLTWYDDDVESVEIRRIVNDQ